MLKFVPDRLTTQKICDDAVRRGPYTLYYVPYHFITQKMCNGAMCDNPAVFFLIPNRFKTQEMCNKTVHRNPWLLKYVPDWFVIQQQIKLWHDNDDYHDRNCLIKWYDGYKKRKAQKEKIKKELIPIAWHPSRWSDWCMTEDEKKGTEKLLLTV